MSNRRDFTKKNTEFTGTDSIIVPKGTTAERSGTELGQLRYNTDLGFLEQYNSTGWAGIDAPPTLTSTVPASFDGTAGTSITCNGSNFKSGSTVKFITALGAELSAGTTTYVSSTQLTATIPRNILANEGPLSIKVTNPSGLAATLEEALNSGAGPTWNTAAGTVATVLDSYGTAPSVSLSASDPDGGPVTYSLTTGSVPSGMTLNTSTGVISGDPVDVSGATQSTFTVAAEDNAGNTASRQFNIIVNPVLDGTSSGRAARSAYHIIKQIQAAGGSSSDWQALTGPLWLDPGNSGSPFQVWCDMETQGGGWTLAIKWDQNQASSSLFSLERAGGRSYVNTAQLDGLDPQGALYATLNVRDIIAYSDSQGWTNGGRYMMHASTSVTNATTPAQYTGHNFTASVPGADVGVIGGNTLSFSPIFSKFHNNIRTSPNNLWDTQASWITNSGGGGDTATSQYYDNASDIATYGGGVFYALGTDPDNPSEAIDPNAGYDDHASVNSNSVARQNIDDGRSMFSCVNREGSVYCSGTNNAGSNTGHNSPKFNWGWYSADGSQQSYGYGSWCIGTPCASGFSGTNTPHHRMNYMFVR
jgi:hypothetical protein